MQLHPYWRAHHAFICLILIGASKSATASVDHCHQAQNGHPRDTDSSLLQIATLTQAVKGPLFEDAGVEEMMGSLLDPVLLGMNGSGSEHAPLVSNGVVVVRIPKTGSTTLQGVVRRIGDLHGMALWKGLQSLRAIDMWARSTATSLQDMQQEIFEVPVVYTGHGRLRDSSVFFDEYVPRAFRLTMVRDPAERCMSAFYHLFESKQGTAGKHDDEAKVAFITGECDYFTNETEQRLCSGLACQSFMTNYLLPYDNASIAEILDAFDFIGVTERFAESMVVLKKDLSLDLADFIYVKVKEAGVPKDCQAVESAANSARIPLAEESDEVQLAAGSLRSSIDMDLIRAVNASLDERIANYGPSFESDLAIFHSWLDEAEAECRCVGTDKLASMAFACISELVQRRGWSRF